MILPESCAILERCGGQYVAGAVQKRRGPRKGPDTKITIQVDEDHGLGRAGAMGHRPVPGTFVERAAGIQAAAELEEDAAPDDCAAGAADPDAAAFAGDGQPAAAGQDSALADGVVGVRCSRTDQPLGEACVQAAGD